MRKTCSFIIFNYKIFVAIQKVDFGSFVYLLHIFKQQIAIEIVIVIDEATEVAHGGSDTRVGVFSDAEVLLKRDNRHTAVTYFKSMHSRRKCRKLGTRIHKN